jgi:hypothetical protein
LKQSTEWLLFSSAGSWVNIYLRFTLKEMEDFLRERLLDVLLELILAVWPDSNVAESGHDALSVC